MRDEGHAGPLRQEGRLVLVLHHVQRPVRVPHDPADLRVLAVAQQDHVPPRLRQLGGEVLSAAHEGAGHVEDPRALLPQGLQHLKRLAVRSDKHVRPRRDLALVQGHTKPHPLEPLHLLRIVDRQPDRPHGPSLLQGLQDGVHRSLHAEAEAGVKRHDDLLHHTGAPAQPPASTGRPSR